MSKKQVYQITEYQSFAVLPEEECNQYDEIKPIDAKTFASLKGFIYTNKNKSTDATELMSISSRRFGEVITAQNYVGVITLKDGTSIEILPKISRDLGDDDDSIKTVKGIFIDMLKTLPNFNNKSLQTSNIDTSKMSIFEAFIRMFIDEVSKIVKRGLKSDYILTQDNLSCFKGKLLVAEHIKRNFAHAEKNYVEFDEFSINRPENKIIKATLELLYRQSTSSKNKKDIRLLLAQFDDVDTSSNYEDDFAKCRIDRNMADYDRALIWCKVFLKGKSFTSYAGSTVAIALLFPMNDIFESFVACQIKAMFRGTDYRVSIQDRIHYLYSSPTAFLLKPDIVVRAKDGKTYIFDTKWKILSKDRYNYNISRDDMYQMYAYQHKYKAEDVTLIYPQISELSNEDDIKYEDCDETRKVCDLIRVRFVDLFSKDSLEATLQQCVDNIGN